MKDKIQFQQFKQISETEWKYEITTQNQAKYWLRYKVLRTGFTEETLQCVQTDEVSKQLVSHLVYQREFRVGEALHFTFEDVIKHFGNVTQALEAKKRDQQTAPSPQS